MIGFNHALVGGLIGKFLPLPIAIPLAIASHFMLDALPHYGIANGQRDKSKLWKPLFIVDFFATLGLAYLTISQGHYAVFFCGLIAVVPDFVWVARVVKTKSFNLSKNKSWYTKWHAKIQRYERPWGIYLELPLAVILYVCLFAV